MVRWDVEKGSYVHLTSLSHLILLNNINDNFKKISKNLLIYFLLIFSSYSFLINFNLFSNRFGNFVLEIENKVSELGAATKIRNIGFQFRENEYC